MLLLAGIKCSNYGPVDFNSKELGNSSRLFESTITYKCKTGWRKTRGNGTRICLSDGNWTGEHLVCESRYIACYLFFLFKIEHTATVVRRKWKATELTNQHWPSEQPSTSTFTVNKSY